VPGFEESNARFLRLEPFTSRLLPLVLFLAVPRDNDRALVDLDQALVGQAFQPDVMLENLNRGRLSSAVSSPHVRV